ncbi:MAG: GreA/GreB family elongation factor [Candidatus Paceibacterota bacterium]|jgi:transcription elongation GreA/GreB family factor
MEEQKIKSPISMGMEVNVKLSSGEVRKIKIVRASEANPQEGLVSDICPIGKTLLGSLPGEKKTYSVNGKEFEIEILG